MRYKTTLAMLLLAVCSTSLQAQNKYIDTKGEVTFEASEALFEPVKATNKSVTGVLEIETGKIASLALIKGFRFKNSLMEEHFNENYIESETYPKAIFKGVLKDFDYSQLTETIQKVVVDGKLMLREKEKAVTTVLSVQKVDNSILMKGSFIVTPSDFDIDIPKIVVDKIAKEIRIELNFKFQAK